MNNFQRYLTNESPDSHLSCNSNTFGVDACLQLYFPRFWIEVEGTGTNGTIQEDSGGGWIGCISFR